jgi:hypothetical protein
LKVHFAQVFIGVYSDVALCKGFFFLLDGVFFNVLSFVLGEHIFGKKFFKIREPALWMFSRDDF